MTCGLPTFATCHGGPAEIIENGVSGFHVDPYHPDQVSAILIDFFESCQRDPDYWSKISDGGLKRIFERSLFAWLICIWTIFSYLNVTDLEFNSIGTHGRYILRGY